MLSTKDLLTIIVANYMHLTPDKITNNINVLNIVLHTNVNKEHV